MKPHKRRMACAYPYYKLATWDDVSKTWRDGKKAFPTIGSACEAANDGQGGGSGRFRVSVVTEDGRNDIWPFINSDVFSCEDEDISGRVIGYEDDGLVVLVADEAGKVHHVPQADLELSGGGMVPCP